MHSANGKRSCSELLKIGYMFIIGNFLTPHLNVFILTTKLFFQIHINSVVFRDIFVFLTETQSDIFMEPGMLDMHYRSIDLFDTCVKPHLTWLCVCMRAYITSFYAFHAKALLRLWAFWQIRNSDVFLHWNVFHCGWSLEESIWLGVCSLPCICMISMPAALQKNMGAVNPY